MQFDFDSAYQREEGGVGAAADALIDMYLLAKCDTVMLSRRTVFAAIVPYIFEKEHAIFLDHDAVAAL